MRDLHEIGDPHNPEDPHFAAFKARTLQQYDVQRVEDLPLNYRGLLAMEGEALTSRLFDKYARQQLAEQRKQRTVATGFGLLSPAIALRSVSMALSGTDLEGHRRFLDQAESYRYDIVQRLNRLQAEEVTFADDGNRNTDPEAGRRVKIDPAHWHEVPDFTYKGATVADKMTAALPGTALLLLWLLALGLALRVVAGRLGKVL
jgi:ABC-2 type transport system permease protein